MTSPIGPAPGQSQIFRWGFRAVAAAALLVGLWFVQELRRSIPPPTPEVGSAATVLPVPKPLPEFSLLDQAGEPFGRERLRGRWSFLFFGYTHCPSICPLTMGAMRDLRRQLVSADPAMEDTQFVFVSVDPARDAPETLREYVSHFDPAFVGASGEAEELGRLTGELGVFHERTPGGTEQAYDFDHTASLLLVDPDADLYAVFSPPVEPEDAAQAFRAIWAIRQLEAEPGELRVHGAWVEPPPAGHGPAGGFLTVENGSDRTRTLLGASSPACERVEIHRSSLEDGIARMARLESVEIPAGGTLRFAPGGLHLMLFGAHGLAAGGFVPLQLELDGGETREVRAEVRPAGGASHAHEHH